MKNYFHVLLSSRDSSEQTRCILSDLSETDLKSKFVVPYRRGGSILCGNEVIELSNARKVTLIRTAEPIAVELKRIQEESRRHYDELNRNSSVLFVGLGRGYESEDIVEAGTDVTTQFISGPPGQGGIWTAVASAFNHQWVVAVGSGLLVAVLIWWFGWN